MKIKYIGDEQFVQYADEEVLGFQRDKWVEVADDHPLAGKLRNNPQFQVDGVKPRVAAHDDSFEERDRLIAQLEARGDKVDRRKSLAALQEQLAGAGDKEA